MKLSEELQWRGFTNQTTFEDSSVLDGAPISFYFGVDPSADSMQIGNLAAAMMVRHFIEAGHKAFLLVGGATGIIGDPDGKAEERKLQTLENIARNKAGIAAQYRTIFAGKEFTLVDNYEWFQHINYLDFLRLVGKNVPMSSMLGRDFVQSRLGKDGSGISYAEFSYSLIQGYDFLHLYRQYGVTLRVSGADQWGNSIAGVDLIRRLENAKADVYTAPLVINKSTGVKFGKSEGGAIWLDTQKTSPYKFYQFWLNVDDEGVGDYLKIYTLLSRAEVKEIMVEQAANPGARSAQRKLAEEVTRCVHGDERTTTVQRVTAVLFGEESFDVLSGEEVDLLEEEITTVRVNTIIDALLEAAVVKSKGDARRLISSGAITCNGNRVEADEAIIAPTLLKKGKNTFVLVR